jgi:hypothetical protein
MRAMTPATAGAQGRLRPRPASGGKYAAALLPSPAGSPPSPVASQTRNARCRRHRASASARSTTPESTTRSCQSCSARLACAARVYHTHRQRKAAAVREEVPHGPAERRPARIAVHLVEAGQATHGHRLVGRATSAASEQRGHRRGSGLDALSADADLLDVHAWFNVLPACVHFARSAAVWGMAPKSLSVRRLSLLWRPRNSRSSRMPHEGTFDHPDGCETRWQAANDA